MMQSKDMLKSTLKKRFNGKRYVTCKYRMKYPHSAEREYTRLTNAYMQLLKESIEENIIPLKKSMWDGTRFDSAKDNEKLRKKKRMVNFTRTVSDIENIFDAIAESFEKKIMNFNLRGRLNSVAKNNARVTVNEWAKSIIKTLGVSINKDYYNQRKMRADSLFDDYFSGEYFREAIPSWVEQNINLISTLPHDTLDKMKQAVIDGYVNGRTTTDVMKEIQNEYGIGKRHARLIARDQSGKLNSQINQKQQKDAGVDKYEWSDSGDGRVRTAHAHVDGKIFDWDNDKGKPNGCNPGEDYQCRCVALPVFDIDNLDLPYDDLNVSVSFNGEGHDTLNRTYKPQKRKAASNADRNTGRKVIYDENKSYKIHLDEYSEKINDSLSKAARNVAKAGSENGYEYLQLVNLEDGTLEDMITDKDFASVGGREFWDFIYKTTRKFAFIHNHNTDGFLSEADMRTLLSTENIPVMIAVRNDGVIYAVERKGKIITNIDYDSFYPEDIDALNKKVKDGIIEPYKRNFEREIMLVNNLIRDYTKGGKVNEFNT